jgi:hypothetical protein
VILDPRFATTDDPSDMRRALEGERVMGLSLSRRWIGGEGPVGILKEIHALAEDGAPRVTAKGTLADWAWSSWIARPLAYRDALRLLDLMEKTLSLLDVPARDAMPVAETLRDEYRTGVPNLVSHLRAVLPVQAIDALLEHQARVRIARVGLAVLELRQTTGAWPGTLEAVVPMVGAEWIEDPYTGKPLEYEPGVRLEAAVPIPNEDRADDEIAWRFPP